MGGMCVVQKVKGTYKKRYLYFTLTTKPIFRIQMPILNIKVCFCKTELRRFCDLPILDSLNDSQQMQHV